MGWVSIQILSGHVNREDRAAERECECEWVNSQCSCVPALNSVGTELPLSETNELRATSFSHPKSASVYQVYRVYSIQADSWVSVCYNVSLLVFITITLRYPPPICKVSKYLQYTVSSVHFFGVERPLARRVTARRTISRSLPS